MKKYKSLMLKFIPLITITGFFTNYYIKKSNHYHEKLAIKNVINKLNINNKNIHGSWIYNNNKVIYGGINVKKNNKIIQYQFSTNLNGDIKEINY